MREILFRARTVSESEYMDDGEWIEGFYTCFNGDEHRIYTGYSETDCGDHYPDWFNVLPETVEQYTGLTDKNDEKIFEGDIVIVKGFIESAFIVIYYNGGFKLKEIGEPDLFAYYITETMVEEELIEIIGNIHDNPELLEADNDRF